MSAKRRSATRTPEREATLAVQDRAPPKPSFLNAAISRKAEEMSTDNPAPRPNGFGLADLICLAAAPTFAGMALLTAAYGGGDMMCMSGGSMLSGMVPMYLLMAAFHLAPWLRLVAPRNVMD
jgi:hypothetical protein